MGKSCHHPKALWESIQCNLPKPNKVHNQRIAVSQLRPICVFSIWWRLYSSMWARAEGVRQWIANVLPKTSLTTLGTEHMCAQLLDSYAKCGYIASLGYTQAFESSTCSTLSSTSGMSPPFDWSIEKAVDKPVKVGDLESLRC